MRILLLIIFAIATVLAQIEAIIECPCSNGGVCQANSPLRCQCPAQFMGDTCQIPAIPLSSTPVPVSLNTTYTYFYFTPFEVNYYRLTFTLCMLNNPSLRPTLFYVETEKSDGSLRAAPSLFETAKLVLGGKGCSTFSTHYISVKRREDESFRRIVVGLKVMEDGEQEEKYLNTYVNLQQLQQSNGTSTAIGEKTAPVQEITIMMTSEVYLQSSYFGTFLILFTAFVLLLVFVSFITYIRRRYTMEGFQLQLDALNLQADIARLRRDLQSLNPEDTRQHTKNSLHNLQIFMPVTHYGTPQSIFVPHLLSNKEQQTGGAPDESCSICLAEFQVGDEVRTTPCSHLYHRECIDNWCQNRLSCPICRRALDFTREVRQLYYDFLRNDLAL